jgi:hypothetical protein
MSPATLQTFIGTPDCVLEDNVQYSTVHITNVLCDGHLQIINFMGIVWVHCAFCTVIIRRCTETFWSPYIYAVAHNQTINSSQLQDCLPRVHSGTFRYVQVHLNLALNHSQVTCCSLSGTSTWGRPSGQPGPVRFHTRSKTLHVSCIHSGEQDNTVMRRLTSGIRFEKCVVRLFRRCANVIQCTYTKIDSIAYNTTRLYGIAYCS